MPKILLKGGHVTEDARMDRIYPGVEAHMPSLAYLARDLTAKDGVAIGEKPLRSFTWSVPEHLDQGNEGRCVEYSICHELLARPVKVPSEQVQSILAGKKIYWPAQENDEWPGGSYPGADPVYEGTSVLSGMKTAASLGYYTEYRWGLNATELAQIVGYKGPGVLGINVYAGMMNIDPNGFLNLTGEIVGGHAILCNSFKLVKKWNGSIDDAKSYFMLWNSWGPSWGLNGSAKVRFRDMERLIAEQGEVALPVVRKVAA